MPSQIEQSPDLIAQQTYGALIENGVVSGTPMNFDVTRWVAQGAKTYPNKSPEEWRARAKEIVEGAYGMPLTSEAKLLMSGVSFALWRNQGGRDV